MPADAKQTWSVVVFCYNEAATVSEVLYAIVRVFEEHRKGRYEIIAVDDGSRDGSREKIEAFQKAHSEQVGVVRHTKNLGIGQTLVDGYRVARNENITAIPADGQFDVRELIPYLDIAEGTFVSFYRLENAEYSRARNILSAGNKWVNRFCNGINLKDVNWVKIYKRKAIISFPWKLSSSLIESEICAKLLLCGVRAIEVLSYYHPRKAGKSKGASPMTVLRALREVPKLIYAVHRFRRTIQKKA